MLALTTLAFFISYVVWFNYAPLTMVIQEELGLTDGERGVIGLCNIALTIPSRLIIGMFVDRYGPRLTFSALLVCAAIPCFMFASANTFAMLMVSRLLIGIIGAGFVVGVRMVAEWFPSKISGLIQGLYASWGNLGSAATSVGMVAIASIFGVLLSGGHTVSATGFDMHWRAAIAFTGILSAIYGVVYYFGVADTPPGTTFQRPLKHGAMEVTSRKDFFLLLVTNLAFLGVMLLLTWRLLVAGLYDTQRAFMIAAMLGGVYLFQSFKAWTVNQSLMVGIKRYAKEERYRFSQVAILELATAVNFGSELASVTILPIFLMRLFGASPQLAGGLATVWVVSNVFFRPLGGLLSDFLNRKWTLCILIIGLGGSFLLMGGVSSSSNLSRAILVTLLCALFVQAGQGATYAMVPLIVRRLTGQVAGNVAAYGNVGAVAYLTVWTLLPKVSEALANSFQSLFF
ncbi:MAG: MFS transporter, partial [Cyanobacteria bacterium P01_G01_bin.4]